MNALALVDALGVWSAQICVLVALGAIGAWTFRHPKVRLLFWQGLLLLLLLLPALEPWRRPAQRVPAEFGGDSSFSIEQHTTAAPNHLWTRVDLLWIVAGGALLRLLWLAMGLMRLRRYRNEGRRLPAPPWNIGKISAHWYLHHSLPGPVTYGCFRPVILLPERFNEMQSSIQEAIACHELIHVRRRDWLFVVGEELVRSASWFHPAIWFLLSRIHLAREQVVDREAIQLTRDRDRYLDALLDIAAQSIQPDLAPAPLFLKKRHLAHRVAAVLQEVSMSRPRLYMNLATACSVMALALRLSISLVPFSSPAQTTPDDPGVAVLPGPGLLHRAPLHFPAGTRTSGTVVVEATLNPNGEVSDARVVSGPDDLRKSVLQSVLDWHFAPGARMTTVTIVFKEASASPTVSSAVADTASASALTAPALTFRMDPNQALKAWPATLKDIRFEGLTAAAEREIRSRLPVQEGATAKFEEVQAMLKTVEEFDSHLRNTVQVDGKGEFSLVIFAFPPLESERSETLVAPPTPGVARFRVGGNISATNLEHKVTPVYPVEAKKAKLQGTVRLTALIGTDGTVQKLQPVSGPPVLVEAATEAVKQWTYRPTIVNGSPIEVVTQIDVNFRLMP